MATDRLNALLDAVWEHSLPLGPFGDYLERERLEADWQATLSEEDCLALLRWARTPVRPAHWDSHRDRWIRSLANDATHHVAVVAERFPTPRLLTLFADLLCDPASCEIAFDVMYYLGPAAASDNLFCGAVPAPVPISDELARVMTEAQVARLRQVAGGLALQSDVRRAIDDILRAFAEIGP